MRSIWTKGLLTLSTGPSMMCKGMSLGSLQTQARVDDFKELQSLITALFNPGLHDHHWEKTSSIAGQDLHPTEVSLRLCPCDYCQNVATEKKRLLWGC